MSTPEQPATPALTRKQMREIRNTGSTPVITPETTADDGAHSAPTSSSATTHTAQQAPPAPAPAPVIVAPLPRAAEPAVVAPAPAADSSVDLGASPLTRRQARQQERIRTASVPVITPEVAAAYSASVTVPPASPLTTPALAPSEPVSVNSGMHDLFGLAPSTAAAPVVVASQPTAGPEPKGATAPKAESAPVFAPWDAIAPDVHADVDADEAEADPRADLGLDTESDDEDEQKERVVSPLLGAGLLSGTVDQAELPPSFDQLLARSTGSISMPNALILSQAPEIAPMVAPLSSSTGEVLITGTLNLPEGLGSTGHALGTADGKEVDATLVDGELPAHSSPTPIAASAAISTVKTAGEVIRPPVPEKGSRLMLTLAITAGALALALVGVLILAFVTGVF